MDGVGEGPPLAARDQAAFDLGEPAVRGAPLVSSNGGGGYGSERVVEQHACSVRTAQRVR